MVAAIFHDFRSRNTGIVFPSGQRRQQKEEREKNDVDGAYEKARKGGEVRGGGEEDEAKEKERRKIKAGGGGGGAAAASSNEVRSHVKGLRIIRVAPVSAACWPIRRFSDTIYNQAG